MISIEPTPITTRPIKPTTGVAPQNVLTTLEEHILVDGFKLIFDVEKSHGSHFVDAATGREFLDLYNAAAAALAGGTHAEALVRQALGRRPDDVPARMNLERLATPGWDGVFVLEGK